MTAPLSPQALRQQAERQASARDWPNAIASFESLLALKPDDADVLLQLSYVSSLAGHYRRARDYTLRANAAMPRDLAQVRELVARLRTFNAVPELHACIERLKPVSRMPIPLLIDCAGQLSTLNEQEAALALLDEARRGDPQFPPTLIARAQVLTYLGRFDAARDELLAALRRAPEIARIYWLLANLRKQTTDDNHIEAIRAQLARPGRRPEEVAELAYALHKSLDDLGDHAPAWAALEQACQAKRSRLDYRSADSQALIDFLIAMPAAPAQDTSIWSRHADARTPVFIIGMHRSGTTLLEQLLHGHPDVRGLGELYDFTSQMRQATDHHCRGVIDSKLVQRTHGVDFAAVGQGYLDGVAWRLGGERCFTDKLPSNFLNAGFICRALPQARLLHLRRDPMETGFSNLRELFSDANAYSYDQRELAHFHGQYQRLMAHWHAAYPGRILDVDYAALTSRPEATMRRVAEFCGLEFDPAMLNLGDRTRAVATASAVSVRQGVVSRDVPKWAPYAEYLQPMADALRASGVLRI